jgi:hypothetical protein
VALHGGLREEQALRDLPVRTALGDQVEHLPFPRREHHLIGFAAQRADHVHGQRLRHPGVDDPGALGDMPQPHDQVVGLGVRQQHAVRAGCQALPDQVHLGERGQDHDVAVPVPLLQGGAGRGRTRRIGCPQVQHDPVGLESGCDGDRFGGGARLPELERREGLGQQGSHPPPCHRVVVDHQHPHRDTHPSYPGAGNVSRCTTRPSRSGFTVRSS